MLSIVTWKNFKKLLTAKLPESKYIDKGDFVALTHTNGDIFGIVYVSEDDVTFAYQKMNAPFGYTYNYGHAFIKLAYSRVEDENGIECDLAGYVEHFMSKIKREMCYCVKWNHIFVTSKLDNIDCSTDNRILHLNTNHCDARYTNRYF